MTDLEVLFVALNYLTLVPVVLVLVVIGRQQRLYKRRQQALEHALRQAAMPVQAVPASVAVTASHAGTEDAPLPPWLRSNYIAPEDFRRVGFDYTIQARTAALPWRVRDQGGFAMIQNRYHRRQGGTFTVKRKICLN